MIGQNTPLGAMPQQGTSYGVNTGSPTYAQDTYAALSRDQWNNYVANFIPIENKLINYATDPTQVTQAMQKASTNVSNAFDAQQGATQRSLAGQGVTLSADEQAAQTRAMGLSKSLADVGAQNNAREATVQRQQGILGNPTPQGV